jgi:hypothetical protein
MSLRVTVCSELKSFWDGGEAKASPKWAIELQVVDPKRR